MQEDIACKRFVVTSVFNEIRDSWSIAAPIGQDHRTRCPPVGQGCLAIFQEGRQDADEQPDMWAIALRRVKRDDLPPIEVPRQAMAIIQSDADEPVVIRGSRLIADDRLDQVA